MFITRESAIDGELIAVDENQITLRMDGKDFNRIFGPIKLGREWAGRIGKYVRISGMGGWRRSEAGEWKLESLQAWEIKRLSEFTLAESIAKLRALNVEWPHDAIDRIMADRED